MIKKGTNKLYICLAALTVFGNGAFTLGYSKNFGVDIISALLNLALTAVTLFIAAKLSVALKEKLLKLKLIFPVILISLSVLCLLFGLISLKNLVDILKHTLAEEINVGLIVLSILLAILALTLSKKKAILKFSLVFFFVVLGLVILIFSLSVPFMDFKYLKIETPTPFTLILKQTAQRFLNETLLVLIPLSVLCFNKSSSVGLGGSIGSAMVLLTVLNTILIFGPHFSSELLYPYEKAVSAVSLGALFSRMDLCLYPVCFFPGLVRVSVEGLAAVILFKKAKKYYKNAK